MTNPGGLRGLKKVIPASTGKKQEVSDEEKDKEEMRAFQARANDPRYNASEQAIAKKMSQEALNRILSRKKRQPNDQT